MPGTNWGNFRVNAQEGEALTLSVWGPISLRKKYQAQALVSGLLYVLDESHLAR